MAPMTITFLAFAYWFRFFFCRGKEEDEKEKKAQAIFFLSMILPPCLVSSGRET